MKINFQKNLQICTIYKTVSPTKGVTKPSKLETFK